MLVYYFVPFIVSNRYLLFWVSNGHNSVTVQNRTHVYMNFFDHKDLGNHLLQLCPKVVKHSVYSTGRPQFLEAFSKVRTLVISFVMYVSSFALLYVPLSVRFPYGTTQFQQDRFSLNFILEDFTKIYRENLSLFEMPQEQMVLYVTTNVHLWLCLAQFFLEWEIFHMKFVEEIKTHFTFNKVLTKIVLFIR